MKLVELKDNQELTSGLTKFKIKSYPNNDTDFINFTEIINFENFNQNVIKINLEENPQQNSKKVNQEENLLKNSRIVNCEEKSQHNIRKVNSGENLNHNNGKVNLEVNFLNKINYSRDFIINDLALILKNKFSDIDELKF